MPTLIQALKNPISKVRWNATRTETRDIGPEAIDAVLALIIASRDQKASIYLYPAQALEKIKKSLPEATDSEDFDF